MPQFQSNNSVFYYETFGDESAQPFFWGHGWGQSHEAFLPLARSFENTGHHTLIDFPGFGKSPEPPEGWGSEDYADAIAAYIKARNLPPVVWVGHSFGGRVGLRLASRYPELVKKMFLIGSAGLKPKRPWHKTLYMKLRIYAYKSLKLLIPLGLLSQEWLMKRFGSSDYRNTSGIMRQVFIKVVNEDQSQNAKEIKCPVQLVYGSEDTEAPPSIGERLSILIPDADLVILNGQDHYSVLSSGRHPVAGLLGKFIK